MIDIHGNAPVEPRVWIQRPNQPLVRARLSQQIHAVRRGGAIQRIKLDGVQASDPCVVAALVSNLGAGDRLPTRHLGGIRQLETMHD